MSPTPQDRSSEPLPADETPLEEELTLAEAAPAPSAETSADDDGLADDDLSDDDLGYDELDPPGTYLVPEPEHPLAAPGPNLPGALGVELLGTFGLVLAGVGVGMYAAATQIGPLGTALAFGLALFALVAAFGRVSGGHFNPAVTLGSAMGGRTPWLFVLPYWFAQTVGAALATTVLFIVARSNPQIDTASLGSLFKSASNAFGTASPYGFGLVGVLILEVVVTGLFVAVILAVTAREAQRGLAAPTIGMTLAFGLLILTPVSGGSMNPARSLASALFAGSEALGQVWVFWVAPLLGAAIAGLLYSLFNPVIRTVWVMSAEEDAELEASPAR